MSSQSARATRILFLATSSVSALCLTVPIEASAQTNLPAVTVVAPTPRQAARPSAPAKRSVATRSQARRAAPATQPAPVVAQQRSGFNSTAQIGALPPAYAGGQVGSGSALGLLGNRSVFDQPFTSTSYTETLIRDQQSRNVQDVLNNDPSVRTNVPANSGILGFLIRGFPVFAQDMAFNGLFGVADSFNPAIEQFERVEVLRGPATLLMGTPPFGNIGGIVNLIPKRAGDVPLNRLTLGYTSNGQAYQAIDVSRRLGEWGVRFNGALNNGATPIDNQTTHFGAASLAVDYRGERLRASLDLGYQELDYNSPLRNRSVQPGFQIPAAPDLRLNQQQPWEYRDSSNISAAVKLEYDLTENLTAYGAYGRSNFRQEYFGGVLSIFNARGDYSEPINYIPFRIVNETAEVGLRSIVDTGPVKHRLGVAATGFSQENAQQPPQVAGSTIISNLYNPVYVAPRSPFGLSNQTPRTSTRDNTSVAIADTMSILGDRVQFTIGGRWQELIVNSFSSVTGAQTGSSTSQAFSPGVGLVVKPIDRLSIYGNYVEGLTSPAPPITAVNANAAFPAIVSRQSEVGAKYDFGKVGVGAALFEIEQPFGFLSPTTNTFSIDGRLRNRGVELTVFGEPVAGVRVIGGLSLFSSRQISALNPATIGNAGIGVPNVQLNLYGEYDLPPGFIPNLTLTGRIVHTSSQFYDLANTQSIPDWTTLDVGVRHATRFNGRPLTLRANVLNVTGLNYWATTGRGILSQGAPRTYLLSASMDF